MCLSARTYKSVRLFFKVLFVPKCIKMIFFHFLKIIFEIRTLKQSKTYKKNLILTKKKLSFLGKQFAPRSQIKLKVMSLLIYLFISYWCF